MDPSITSSVGSAAGAEWKTKVLNGGATRNEQIAEVAKEFEGILVRQFLNEALKPMSEEGGFFGTGKSSPMQEQIIKDALANSITQGGSLGFTSVLQAQFQSNPEVAGDSPEKESK